MANEYKKSKTEFNDAFNEPGMQIKISELREL